MEGNTGTMCLLTVLKNIIWLKLREVSVWELDFVEVSKWLLNRAASFAGAEKIFFPLQPALTNPAQ